ncbi:hypothetical protein BDV25DRAFT_151737 [Aspergillus avenaceus]|uniref:Uncharacterized protein n=1 Tax=Aspergillus avenaceus TaxID=36643 RepID=A0A5N6U053_ASPAV|nr:hypothetical protein BDV25DRAFT_151737 [Aspergillus avenaceus]
MYCCMRLATLIKRGKYVSIIVISLQYISVWANTGSYAHHYPTGAEGSMHKEY